MIFHCQDRKDYLVEIKKLYNVNKIQSLSWPMIVNYWTRMAWDHYWGVQMLDNVLMFPQYLSSVATQIYKLKLTYNIRIPIKLFNFYQYEYFLIFLKFICSLCVVVCHK